MFETPGLCAIVTSYAYDYSRDLVNFCEKLGFTQFLKEIHTQNDRNKRAFAELTQELLQLENKTEETCIQAKKEIQRNIDEIKKEHQEALDKKIKQQESKMQLLLEEQTREFKAKIACLEKEAHLQLEYDKQALQQGVQAELQTRLKYANESGFIAKEKEKHALAKKTILEKRLELSESDVYFHEVHRMIQLLEGLPVYIQNEIDQKNWWNNRLRLCDLEELDNRFRSTGDGSRICGILLWAFTFGVCGAFIGIFLGLALAASAPIALFATVYFTTIGISILCGTLVGAIASLWHVDLDIQDRFEAHKLSYSFSRDLLAKFEEIKARLSDFQKTSDAILQTEIKEEAQNAHPLMTLAKNAKVKDIREAVKTELKFFKELRVKSPCYQDELKEEHLDMDVNMDSVILSL